MNEDNVIFSLDDTEGYINISIWEQEDNRSTYYDRKLDTQGIVPGRALEEVEKVFQEKYNVKL